MGIPPNGASRLISRRWERQRQRNAILPDPHDGLPRPGMPYWRVARQRLGLPCDELPMHSPYKDYAVQAEQTDRRRAWRAAKVVREQANGQSNRTLR